MANAMQESNTGGISFSTPIFSFGNTSPSVNSGLSFDLPLAAIQSFSNQALTFTQNNAENNRGFVSGVISQVGNNVAATGNTVANFQNNALSSITSISSGMQKSLSSAVKSRATGGFCFITTAICRAENKPDDCDELETLRHFRDEVLLKNTEGRIAVKVYYLIAPDIVDAIDRREDADHVYAMLREVYLMPAIHAVKTGNNELAFVIYQQMVNRAAKYLA